MNHNLNNTLPVLALRNLVIYPGITANVQIGRNQSIKALQAAQQGDKRILALLQKSEQQTNVTPEELYRIGTVCVIEKVIDLETEGYQILVRGEERCRTLNLFEKDGYLQSDYEVIADQMDVDEKTLRALLQSLKSLAREILDIVPTDTRLFLQMLNRIEDAVLLSHWCAESLDLPIPQKQELLETISVKTRILTLLELMSDYKDNLNVQNEIHSKMSRRLNKTQRELLLREQLRAIHEELGEAGEKSQEDYEKRIEDANMPEEAKKIALEELRRLQSIGNQSPESHIIRNYLDLLCSLPWSKSAETDIDIEKARTILNQDHYGLEKIKRRILQHLAVMKLKKDGRGSILLFVGPPGVGKTSLGQSIAKALGRKFVRASLGGVRDDSEIRGHRRTYIGAMPGRIVQGIKRASENNPVFMLDEIDKLAISYHGDPAGALLEVLDPEQNMSFLDHYLDTPFDLSKVVFIATANTLDTIPRPLLDRMEVIELTGYTTPEKLHIAKTHLVPKQLQEHGLSTEEVQIPDETLLTIITHHTREAGVRELQRKIAAVARAAAEKILTEIHAPWIVKAAELEDILGPERFAHETVEKNIVPGLATGLAWTPLGGEILFIETTLMPGKGKLILTGQLGEVMKESAQIALSVVRSLLPGIMTKLEFDKKDLHIHVPAGAIPKDGPSAGIALCTALASLFTGISVKPHLGMTGEITLRGAVLPVGGIKEKVIGAHRAGISHIILPKRNERDLRDVPEEVRSQIRFDFVDRLSEVFEIALGIEVAKDIHDISRPISPAA